MFRIIIIISRIALFLEIIVEGEERIYITNQNLCKFEVWTDFNMPERYVLSTIRPAKKYQKSAIFHNLCSAVVY